MNIPPKTQSFELKQALTGEDRGLLLARQPNKPSTGTALRG
jgi:hypothetical protein